jgi:hypothetical protein
MLIHVPKSSGVTPLETRPRGGGSRTAAEAAGAAGAAVTAARRAAALPRQAAQFELKPVPWAAFLARYRAARQQAEAGGAQAAGAGGAGGDAGVRLGEFLAFGVQYNILSRKAL